MSESLCKNESDQCSYELVRHDIELNAYISELQTNNLWTDLLFLCYNGPFFAELNPFGDGEGSDVYVGRRPINIVVVV